MNGSGKGEWRNIKGTTFLLESQLQLRFSFVSVHGSKIRYCQTMRSVSASAFLLLWALVVNGFRIPYVMRVPTHLLSKSLSQIEICSKGIELTTALKEQVEHKIGKATKNSIADITSIHVKLKGPKVPSTGMGPASST